MHMNPRLAVEDHLAAMYQPIVQLKSGGYLVINPTEALVSIDINSGRSTREHNIEQTATATNLEAAHEIARQLRLRDMAGLVVIDFIDMENNSNIRKVEKAMKEALRNDRARIQVGRISSFGLFEMSRQRIRTGVLEASTRTCPHCDGTGLIRTASSAGLSALRMLEDEAARGRGSRLLLHASQEATLYVLNRKRAELAEIEERYGVFIEIMSDGSPEGARMTVEVGGPPPMYAPRLPTPMIVEADDEDEEIVEDEIEAEVEEDDGEIEVARQGETSQEASEREGRNKRRRRRRRRGRGRDAEGQGGVEAAAESEGEAGEGESDVEAGAEIAEPAAEGEEDGEGRRRRGRRGRRSGRRRGGESAGGEAAVATDGETESEAPAEIEAEVVEVVPVEEKPAPKARRRPRARKASTAPVVEAAAGAPAAEPVVVPLLVVEAEAVAEEPVAKPRRPRRKKADAEAPAAEAEVVVAAVVEPELEPEVEAAAAKPKRRSRAKAATSAVESSIDAPVAEAESAQQETVAEETNEDGSPRRGWWQRTFGAC
jgi:ribonuclease E